MSIPTPTSVPLSIRDLFKQKDPLEDYSFGKIIGNGSFSVVKECFSKKYSTKYCAKIIDKSCFREKEWYHISNEISILKSIRHNNIIHFEEIYETGQSLFIIMECVNGGELFTEVGENGPLSEKSASHILKQIGDGVSYLHDNNITHRDLKLENILIYKEASGIISIRLTDFGLSKKMNLSDEQFMRTRCGTPAYVAPEVILGLDYTKMIDIWSIGVVLYVMLFCKYPFQGETVSEIYNNITSGKLNFPQSALKNPLSNEVKDLIGNLLQVAPERRFSTKEILNHPWIVNNGQPSVSQ